MLSPKVQVLGIVTLVVIVWLFIGSVFAQDWTYTPGQHHLETATAESIWAEAQADYAKAHPEAPKAPRAPQYGFTTPKGICILANEDKEANCALAITCGEYGQCDNWPKEFDTVFDESYDYETPLGRSIVYHEFWHFLQFVHKGPMSYDMQGENVWQELSCRENEAYVQETVWLRKHGFDNEARRLTNSILRHPCRPY